MFYRVPSSERSDDSEEATAFHLRPQEPAPPSPVYIIWDVSHRLSRRPERTRSFPIILPPVSGVGVIYVPVLYVFESTLR